MFILDDVLCFPMNSLLFIFREIHKAALAELREEAERVRQDLSRLYLQLEAGQIGEADFDAREAELLDRLDALEAETALDEDDDGGDDEGEDESPDAADDEAGST